jgi:hypothetical protein
VLTFHWCAVTALPLASLNLDLETTSTGNERVESGLAGSLCFAEVAGQR